jgi:hypothetical protein
VYNVCVLVHTHTHTHTHTVQQVGGRRGGLAVLLQDPQKIRQLPMGISKNDELPVLACGHRNITNRGLEGLVEEPQRTPDDLHHILDV